MKHSIYNNAFVTLIVFLIVLLSGCQSMKNVTSKENIEEPKLWSVLKPLSQEERVKQHQYIDTVVNSEFPIKGLTDGYIILTTGGPNLYEELCMRELLQLSDLAPITILIAGLVSPASNSFFDKIQLPTNVEIVKIDRNGLISLGFDEDYIEIEKYYHPAVWQIEKGIIQNQYLYYVVGQYADIYEHFTNDDSMISPIQVGQPLQKLYLVQARGQERELVQIDRPTLLILWSFENSNALLQTYLDYFQNKVQIFLVLKTTDVRTRYPALLEALASSYDADDRIEWKYIESMKNQTSVEVSNINNIVELYPEMKIYEDQTHEMIRRLSSLQILHYSLMKGEDRGVMLYSFYLFNAKSILVKDWQCRMTLGNQEDRYEMLTILEQAITELSNTNNGR